MRFLLILTLLAWPAGVRAQAPSDPESSIRAALDRSAEGWRLGRLDQYLSCYHKSAFLLLFRPSGVLNGYAALEQAYRPAFTRPNELGQLQIKPVTLRPMAGGQYWVACEWTVTGIPVARRGHFSGVWQQIAGRWVMVLCHFDQTCGS